MSARKKFLGCPLVALLVLSVAGCGSDSSTSGTDLSTLPTATTTTAAPSPTSTIALSTTVAATTAPTDTAVAPTGATTPPTEPASTVVATTESESTTPSTTSREYALVASPVVPSQTAPIDAGNSHPDGVYYASVSEGGDPPPAAGNVVFELVQLFTGQACIDHFGEDEDACVGDYGVETEPTSSVEVDLDGVFISVADASTKLNHQISGTELNALLLGNDPSEGAPADYLYSGFGYLVTYQGGAITRLEQWWTP
ncbi:MAG: hypothetical protein ABIR32_17820 [Ilumatobacteraceae bacterium]